ncbi:MAG: division/cell wall cluster transcriptional repressor MraZ [Anaerolineaceae bacterium]|nr:division/cell wall cluster transcriptional repressor MraZ [Anaerolineaceae bacterium]
MFLGYYEHSIDEKGRLTIPARFRELLVEGAFITQGFDQNLVVMPSNNFEKMYAKVNTMSMTNPAARQLKRLVFAHADRVDLDKAGRLLIPQFLRDSGKLDSAAIIVGVGDNFEIWNPELWEQKDQMLQNPEENPEIFANLDLSMELP